MKATITSLALCATLAAQAAITPHPVQWNILETPLTLGDLPMTASGQQIWGDFNNDGNLDMFIISGQGASPISGLYKNNGNETFTEILTDITMLSMSTATFIDYDNDGNLDLVIGGSLDGTPETAITELYRNSGAPGYEFVLVDEAEFPGISAESNDNGTHLLVAFDYDNDGWTDLLINGNAGGNWEVSGNSRVVALYKNNHGTFELQTAPVGGMENFRPVSGGSAYCGDIDNDGFADIIISGYSDEEGVKSVTDLYINNGTGTFTKWSDSQATFLGHNQGQTFFADINNDGWLDILEIGRDINNNWNSFARLYLNNKDNTFTTLDESATNLLGGGATVSAGDVNNDGWTDLIVSGWGPNATIFYNNGDNSFTQVAVPDRVRARAGGVNFVDFNNDRNLDMSIFGYRDGGENTPDNPTWPDAILKNVLGENIPSNRAPSAPANFTVTRQSDHYLLSWDKATDDTTPQDAICYNVTVKYPDGKVYAYAPADPANGFLKTASIRPFIMGTSVKLYLPEDNYTFGLQAVDNACVGSAFTAPGGSGLNELRNSDITVSTIRNTLQIRNNGSENISFSVISANGQILHTGTCNAGENRNVQTAQPGFYLIRIDSPEGAAVHKITVS